MIKEKKNTITIIYSGVKKEIENVFSLVKSSINGVINIAKKCIFFNGGLSALTCRPTECSGR